MDQLTPLMLSRAAYYQWAMEQPSGKYERVFGEVVKVAAERWQHNVMKAAFYRALDDAITGPGLQVGLDGMTVAVEDHDFEPDVIVHQGPPIAPLSIVIPNPIIIVEILSPSTSRIDSTVKLEAYFRLPQMLHYLLVRADRRAVVHWRRGSELPSHPAIAPLVLEPPGLTIDLAAIYDRAGLA